MLWLSIYLNNLSLEVFGPTESPLVICAGPENRPSVHACNGTATASGITPGQSLGAALALCHTLASRPRDLSAESQALNGLALWAHQFTPKIHLHPGEGLLLEVGGSLRLFGGLEHLVNRVQKGLGELGYSAQLAAAPTPLGSWLLAQWGDGSRLTTRNALQDALVGLPLQALSLPPEILASLRGMGLRRVGELLQLPRADLARRLGQALFDDLDRAFGRRPDPRPLFVPPAEFAVRLPLPAEVENTDALLFAIRRLLLELGGFLRAKDAGVQTLTLQLEHRGRPASSLEVGLLRPSRDPEHLLALVRERLERFTLPAPTDALRLHADRFPALEQEQPDLFRAEQSKPGGTLLLEKLRARLGEEAITGLGLQADHRPEAAWRLELPDKTDTVPPSPARRPLWLFEVPQPLKVCNGLPVWGTPLRLSEGPERIESGWWDGGDAARDYFVAEDAAGERFWVFHDRRHSGWFIQGIFS